MDEKPCNYMALPDHVEQRGEPEDLQHDAEEADNDSGPEVLPYVMRRRAQVRSGLCESRFDEIPCEVLKQCQRG